MKARNALRVLGPLLLAGAAAWWLLAPRQGHDILISDAVAFPIADSPGDIGVILKIANKGAADRLIGVHSAHAERASLGTASTLPIPAGAEPALATDGSFLRLSGISAELSDGMTLPVTLQFQNAGTLTTRARLSAPRTTGDAPGFGLFGIGDICTVGEGEPAPAITLSVARDADGWRVNIHSQEFEFTPDLVDGPHVPGTGHGHLYLDGLKLQRLYGPTARIGNLPPGSYEIRVTLNTNDHRAYVIDDAPVTAALRISVD